MRCPYCDHTKSTVVDTYRLTLEIIRIRRCNRCKNYWQTVEKVDRKVSPPEKAEERIQMNLFEASPNDLTPTLSSVARAKDGGEGQNNSRIISGKTNEVRGNDDEED